MISETTSSIDFKFGYDPDLEIDYVFKAGTFTDSEVNAKSPEMKKILLKYNSKEIISFYEKIFQMKEIQIWKMNYFRNKKNWVNSTYLQKYTLPEMEQFYIILENNVIQIDPVYSGNIEKRKTVLKQLVAYNQIKEIEYRERKLREQRKPDWK
jgi:mannose/fructose/N-acetylgalactosamine-specific phosphotransferase system component IIB